MAAMNVGTLCLILVVPVTQVLSICDLANRVKREDSDVSMTQNDQPCALTLTARDNKQVVVVMYGMRADCIDKATIAIYDGNSVNGTLITDVCQADPWSFASRTRSLTLRPGLGKPLRPFSLDIHAIDSIKTYTTSTGTIISDRFLGYRSDSTSNTTLTSPNNLHITYKIILDGTVTIALHFKELHVQTMRDAVCVDFVRIHGISPSKKLCGHNILPPNMTAVTNELRIEFQTDNSTTYTGFELEYVACYEKRQESNKTENFLVPMYNLEDKVRCVFDVQLTRKRTIITNMTVYSNSNATRCEDMVKIYIDGLYVFWFRCTLNSNILLDFPIRTRFRMIVKSGSKNEFVRGSYKTVPSVCNLTKRIKHNDSNIIVSQNDKLCTLTLTAMENKQVVVVMYGTYPDCIDWATVAFYDGSSTNGTFISSSCYAVPWSFASRTGSLTLRIPVSTKPLRQFSLDVHSIDAIKNYIEATGTITSDRYLGYISGSSAMTTPNNLHAFYRIQTDENVTIRVFFKEMFVQTYPGGVCRDFVKIHGIYPSTELCGHEIIPPNITTVTDKLSIEFYTDSSTTYKGFEVGYIACFDKRKESNISEEFKVPMYQLEDSMRCFLDIQLTGKRMVIISMTVNSLTDIRQCDDMIKIIADEVDVTDVYLNGCKLNTNILLQLSLSRLLRIIVITENRNEIVRGSYKIENLLDCAKEKTSNTSPSSTIYTTVSAVLVSVLLTFAISGIVLAVMYKRGMISVKICTNVDRTYEDQIQNKQENQYSVPTLHDDAMVSEYQNDEFEKGGNTSSVQRYGKDKKRKRVSNPEDIYETSVSAL